MPIAGKIFKVVAETDLNQLAERLSGFKREHIHEESGFKLLTEVEELKMKNNLLRGVFSEDVVIYSSFRGELKPIPITLKNTFLFIDKKTGILLFIVAKKLRANNLASKLNELLFIEPGRIVEAEIDHETLKQMHESNPESTKVIFFDNVDLPNINKLSLYGDALADTTLYNEYLKHGRIWYVVYKSQKRDLTIGVTRNCVVTIFNPISEEDFIEIVLTDIIPLIKL